MFYIVFFCACLYVYIYGSSQTGTLTHSLYKSADTLNTTKTRPQLLFVYIFFFFYISTSTQKNFQNCVCFFFFIVLTIFIFLFFLFFDNYLDELDFSYSGDYDDGDDNRTSDQQFEQYHDKRELGGSYRNQNTKHTKKTENNNENAVNVFVFDFRRFRSNQHDS